MSRMSHLIVQAAVLRLIIGVSALCAASARAELGGDAASVAADTEHLHGIMVSESRQQYDVQDIANATGTRVREYLDREGIVFAVSWSGPAVPDLRSLLGAHYAAYCAALAELNHPGLHRSVRVATPDLIVESGGHLRAYAGRAYLPALIPAGVTAVDLR
jgi:hypothetical protein